MRSAQIAPDAVAKAQATRAPVLTCKYQVADRPQAIRRQDPPPASRACNYQLLLRTTCKKAAQLFRVRVILNKPHP